MFQEAKRAIAARPPTPAPSRSRAHDLHGRRARVLGAVSAIAVIGTIAVFGVGASAQMRAEARVLELEERVAVRYAQLEDQLTTLGDLRTRAEQSRAVNDDSRAALNSTEGFLE